MPITRRPDQPWHHSLTIDLLLRVLSNSVFHPFIASLVPLCLVAGGISYTSDSVRNTIYYAIVICIISILQPLNERIAYGTAREVDHEEEVIVITGGASGLGKCLAESYAMKGATVAVLDKKAVEGDDEIDGVRYFQCDISDNTAVMSSWGAVKKELGTPTVLINSAGIVHGKEMAALSDSEVDRSFAVNTTAQYRLNRLFLDSIKNEPNGGTIVTISSVLGRLGAARLSDYTATKAALTAYHHSLTAELRESHPNVKTILVAPGQLSTEMFSSLEVRPVQRFFGPIVEVSDLAIKIIKMTSEGRAGVIAEPAYARWIGAMEVLPVGAQKVVRDLTGVDTAMRGFGGKGR